MTQKILQKKNKNQKKIENLAKQSESQSWATIQIATHTHTLINRWNNEVIMPRPAPLFLFSLSILHARVDTKHGQYFFPIGGHNLQLWLPPHIEVISSNTPCHKLWHGSHCAESRRCLDAKATNGKAKKKNNNNKNDTYNRK